MLKHRLHDGVYHRVWNLFLDHPKLSPRELQCVLLVTSGMQHKEAADRLGIATSSVRTHLQDAAQLVGVGSVPVLIARLRAEAFAEARQCSPLASPPPRKGHLIG